MFSVILSASPSQPRTVSTAGTLCLLALAVLLAPAAAAQDLLQTLVAPSPEVGDRFGYSVADVPDADGDGRADLLVGAAEEDSGSSPFASGRAHLYSSTTGALLHTLVSPNEEQLGQFGFSVAGVPDADGDGRGDLLVGAPSEDPGSSLGNAGRAYLFSGATGTLLFEFGAPDEELGDRFGEAVAGVPDLDGDGRGDLLVGAPNGNLLSASPGHAYLFSGTTGALLRELTSPNAEIKGTFGRAVAGVPDADGDGASDLLVGAPNEGPGRAYLFSGTTGALLQTLTSSNPEPGGRFGASLSGVPDADADGRGDLLVGAFREDPGASPEDTGRAYLFSGASGAFLHTLLSPNPEEFGLFGQSVAGVPDADGDGRGDLLVGAHLEDPGASPENAGRAYLFSGTTGTLFRELDPPNETDRFFGRAVAGVPDTNGDGRGDLLVGGPFMQAYLFSGAVSPVIDLTAEATTSLTVPPGGSFSFAYTVQNQTNATVTGDLFFTAQNGGGATVAQGLILSGTLPAGQTVSGTYVQQVPQNAPAGDYTYTLRIGNFPDVTVDAEPFTITVTGSVRVAGSATAWSVTDVTPWSSGDAPAAGASAETVEPSVGAYPNPMRSRTTIRYAVEAAAEVRLAVFDVLGREVAVLADGSKEAGRHETTFDAADLPAGVYLVRLETDDTIETQRVTVLR